MKIYRSRFHLNGRRGFTLIELLVVIAILGILSSVVLILINPAQKMARGRDAKRKADLRQIANALDAYFVDHEEYPYSCARLQSEGGCSSANGDSWHTSSLDTVLDILVEEGYFKTLSSDPVNDAFASVWQSTGNSYFYVSEGTEAAPLSGGVAGRYYLLGAFLEDTTDPWTLENIGGGSGSRPRWPNCTTEIGFDGRIFLIRSYRCENDPVSSL